MMHIIHTNNADDLDPLQNLLPAVFSLVITLSVFEDFSSFLSYPPVGPHPESFQKHGDTRHTGLNITSSNRKYKTHTLWHTHTAETHTQQRHTHTHRERETHTHTERHTQETHTQRRHTHTEREQRHTHTHSRETPHSHIHCCERGGTQREREKRKKEERGTNLYNNEQCLICLNTTNLQNRRWFLDDRRAKIHKRIQHNRNVLKHIHIYISFFLVMNLLWYYIITAAVWCYDSRVYVFRSYSSSIWRRWENG